MNILLIILLVIAAIIILLLVAALFMKKDHYVKREIIINAPRQKVFEFLRFLENQEKFNKWANAGERQKEFKGTDGTVGFIYAWKGDKKAGEGEKEIMNIIDGERVDTEIRFKKPMNVTASVVMEMQSLPDNQTKVSLINSGILKYPMNLFIPMAEKNFPKDMDESLLILKGVLEKEPGQ